MCDGEWKLQLFGFAFHWVSAPERSKVETHFCSNRGKNGNGGVCHRGSQSDDVRKLLSILCILSGFFYVAFSSRLQERKKLLGHSWRMRF
eukprot:m.136172 g.136172  ORF g.136172 m.136172 type:complete len:90 (-) comp29838_c0_seq2:295-564(-)